MSCPSTRTNLVLALILAVAGAVLVTRAARGDHPPASSDAGFWEHVAREPRTDGNRSVRETPRQLQVERLARR